MPENETAEKTASTKTRGTRGKGNPKVNYRQENGEAKFGTGRGRGQRPGNAFDFWNAYPELMGNAAKLAWARIPGIPNDILQTSILSTNKFKYDPSYAMVIRYLPSVGKVLDANSALNHQMRELYLQMHRKYRGIASYGYSDLGITFVAMAEAFGLIADLERVYGILNTYPVRNRHFPLHVLTSMGLTPALVRSLNDNMADFRYKLNRLIESFGQLCLPRDYTYLANRIAMNAFVYADSKDARACAIIFQEEKVFKYIDDYANPNIPGAYLTLAENPIISSQTYTGLMEAVREFVRPLLESSDVAKICSDVLAAFGADAVQTLAPLPEDYKCPAVYSESMLYKLHNAEGSYAADEANMVYVTGFATEAEAKAYANNPLPAVAQVIDEKGNYLISVPNLKQYTFTQSADNVFKDEFTNLWFAIGDTQRPGVLHRTHIMDTWKDSPAIEDVCEGSLWKLSAHDTNQEGIIVDSCSTEIITAFRVSDYESDGNDYVTLEHYGALDAEDMSAAGMAKHLSAISKIDWAPITPVVEFHESPNRYDLLDFYGDMDNVCFTLNDETLTQIHDAALLSAFMLRINFKA